MTERLVLTEGQAHSLIYRSERALDHQGRNPGHTIERHITISKADLARRMEDGPSANDRKKVFWRGAFITHEDAARQLVATIDALAALSNEFVTLFGSQADGAFLTETVEVPPFAARGHVGVFPHIGNIHIFARKVPDRPHRLHLITMYPCFDL